MEGEGMGNILQAEEFRGRGVQVNAIFQKSKAVYCDWRGETSWKFGESEAWEAGEEAECESYIVYLNCILWNKKKLWR